MGWFKKIKKAVKKVAYDPYRFKGKTSTGEIVGVAAGGTSYPLGGYVGGGVGRYLDPAHGGQARGPQYQTGDASLEGQDTGTLLSEEEETGARGRVSTSTLLTGGMGLLWPAHLRRQQLIAAQRRGLLRRG